MEAAPGKITVVVGPNGSGKSTLLKSISGIASVFGGTIQVDDQVITHRSPTEIARSGVAYLPQTENVFTNLTVRENLRLAGYTVHERDYPQRVKVALELFPQLSKYLSTKSANLSGGERQMVAMAMALMRKPTVVLFDEPTANLAPKVATQVLNTISSITKDMNLTTVLVEQNAKRALEMGDEAFLLVSGKTVFSGTCRELLDHKELGPSLPRSAGGLGTSPKLTLLYPELGRGDTMPQPGVFPRMPIEDLMWVEKYRPHDLDGCHQPDRGEGEAAGPSSRSSRRCRTCSSRDLPGPGKTTIAHDRGREDPRRPQVGLHALPERERREGHRHRKGAGEGLRELLGPQGGRAVQARHTGRGRRDDARRADRAEADNGGELEVHEVHPCLQLLLEHHRADSEPLRHLQVPAGGRRGSGRLPEEDSEEREAEDHREGA